MDTILTEEQAHDGLLQEYSDAYKAQAGFRPTMTDLHMLGNMELYALVQAMYQLAEDNDEWEAVQAKHRAERKAEARVVEAQIVKHGCGPTLQNPLAAALQEAL